MKISIMSKAIGYEKMNIEKNEEKEISRICSEYVLDVVSRLCSSRGLNRVDVSDYLYKLGYISDVS